MGQQKIFKFTAIFLVCVMLLTTSVPPKKVKAIAIVDDLAILGVVGLCLAGVVAIGAISSDYSVTPAQVNGIKSKIQEGGETLVAGVNALGNAIKTGADKATVQALASGATIYGVLNAIQDVLFPSADQEVIDDFSILYGVDFLYFANGLAVYQDLSVYPNSFYSVPPKWTYSRNIDSGGVTYTIYNVDNVLHPNAVGSAFSLFVQDLKSGSIVKNGSLNYFRFTPKDRAFGSIFSPSAIFATPSSLSNTVLGGSGSYTLPATTIAQAPSINLPATLPQNVKENINSWDGTQDLVLAPPIPWDIPDDDLIIVTPTTGEGTVNPPVDPPDIDTPFPWLETALGAILAGEFFTGLDNALKTASKTLGDVINPAITALEETMTGIKDKVGDIAGTISTGISGVLDPALTGIKTAIGSLTATAGTIAETIKRFFDPPSKEIDWNKLKNITFFDKFPFSIPSDLYYLFSLLAADPVSPNFDFEFQLDFVGGENTVHTVDLSQFDYVALIIRNVQFLVFVFFMLYATKNMIWK